MFIWVPQSPHTYCILHTLRYLQQLLSASLRLAFWPEHSLGGSLIRIIVCLRGGSGGGGGGGESNIFIAACRESRQLLGFSTHMTKVLSPDQHSSAKPCGALLLKWGSPSPASHTSPSPSWCCSLLEWWGERAVVLPRPVRKYAIEYSLSLLGATGRMSTLPSPG